jgi:hypothetical protein
MPGERLFLTITKTAPKPVRFAVLQNNDPVFLSGEKTACGIREKPQCSLTNM